MNTLNTEGAASDRELLELAAKAAGVNIRFGENGYTYDFDHPRQAEWNPLTDDSDALRLAVKLRLEVTHFGDVVTAREWNHSSGCHEEWTGLTGANPYAATRRAIVRAAASLAGDPA